MFDLHRHDEFSSFDGYGKAAKLAMLAKQKGHKALGISNHGNISGLIEHYNACNDNDIKPILGIEAYFQPEFDKEKPRYHLCLFIKNIKGYENLNRIITEASKDTFYYHPIVTFDLLKKYHEGLICSTACVDGYIPSLVIDDEKGSIIMHEMGQFIEIFHDDMYIEILPYEISPGKIKNIELSNRQQIINKCLFELSEISNVKLILTSDSHYSSKEDFPTYIKMHKIGGIQNEVEVIATYIDRYMPSPKELYQRFLGMHPEQKHLLRTIINNMNDLYNKVEDKILSNLKLEIPKFDPNIDSKVLLHDNIIAGLKQLNKYNREYVLRAKEEYEVITKHGFEDYFLIVEDYVKYAKNNEIKVGTGRGSVCNSLIAYALGITEVDSIFFKLDFNRFLRMDKKKLPDIDLDFEKERRDEVINYILNKYEGRAAQICSYGLYKPDVLMNDLCKVCNAADVKVKIKNYISEYIIEDALNIVKLTTDKRYNEYNTTYDNIIIHFINLYKQVRFISVHAAGIAITPVDIIKYTAIQKRTDKFVTAYDLLNLESINVIKFDILGLKTVSELKELEILTNVKVDYEVFNNSDLFQEFAKGNTDGIFQFEKNAAKNILQDMKADCVEDIIAAEALNRPGPLSLKMPQKYAENKSKMIMDDANPFLKYTKETYGTIVYQEQIMAICRNIGLMEWGDIDKLMKLLKGGSISETVLAKRKTEEDILRSKFVAGACKSGYIEKDADELFNSMVVYSFNKGHATGYAVISIYQMFYKLYYSKYFWFIKIKHALFDEDILKYKVDAVCEGIKILTPHINSSSDYSLINNTIREGLLSIKNIGSKAAAIIEQERIKNGKYTSLENFMNRVPKNKINKRIIEALLAAGALEFDKEKYFNRIDAYNCELYNKRNDYKIKKYYYR